MNKWYLALIVCGYMAMPSVADQPRQTTSVDVFVAGIDYPNYRSPSLITTQDGTLVAIALGRTGGEPGYGGDNDLVMKRSFDNGATWSALQVIEQPSLFGEKVNNNMVVLDETNGRLWVLYNRYEGNLGTVDSQPGTTNNTAWARYSDDNGATWSSAADITMGAKDYNNWNTIAFGPGSGIQANNGRLIVPSARWTSGTGWSSYIVYSDDHGSSWQRSALSSPGNLSNEANVVQLANGQIRLNARQNSAGAAPRINYHSSNGGNTWGAPSGGQVVESVHTANERFSLISEGADMNRIVWTGPRGPDRADLVVRTSYDEGQTYTGERLLLDGYSGYSDSTLQSNGFAGVLFETNQARNLTYTSFNRSFMEPSSGLLAYEDFRYASNSLLGNKNGGYGFNGGWAGNADLTGIANPIIGSSDLDYADFPFVIEGDRRPTFFSGAGGSMTRALQTPLDLSADETYYLSILVRTDSDVSDIENSTEALDISLLSGTNAIAELGVQGNESIYVENAGQRFATASDTISKNVEYYLIAKLVAGAGTFDQIFVSALASGQSVPDHEAGMSWTLAGTTAMSSNAMIDRLMITGGSAATWILDELRIGTSFADVVSNAPPPLTGDLDGDGFVGINDLNIVLANWNQNVPPANPLADPSGDGFVGIDDLNTVLGNWNAGTPPNNSANIPEPMSLTLLATGSSLVLLRTRLLERPSTR